MPCNENYLIKVNNMPSHAKYSSFILYHIQVKPQFTHRPTRKMIHSSRLLTPGSIQIRWVAGCLAAMMLRGVLQCAELLGRVLSR